MNVSLDELKKASNIKRNALMLEDIIRQRDHEAWLNKTSTELNEASKQKSPKRFKSMSH